MVYFQLKVFLSYWVYGRDRPSHSGQRECFIEEPRLSLGGVIYDRGYQLVGYPGRRKSCQCPQSPNPFKRLEWI